MPTKSKPAAKVKASVPSKATRISPPRTTFSLYAPDAQEVFLIGDFNGWQGNDLKARKLKDGTWSKSLSLKAGCYQ